MRAWYQASCHCRIALAWCVLIAALAQECCLKTALGDAPIAGSERDFTLLLEGRSVTLPLAYVPAGTVLLGRPGSEERAVRLKQPFYIAVGELDVAAISTILQESERNDYDKRQNSFLSAADRDFMQRNGTAYAATMISLDDAAKVTAKLNSNFQIGRLVSSETLVSERLRLPTAAEWQHAMACGSQLSQRYVNPWPGSSQNRLSDRSVARCKELWEKCGRTDKFIVAPEQVLWLVEGAQGNGGARLEILSFLFPFLLDGRGETTPSWRRFETKPEPLKEVLALGLPNDWGIRGSYRGFPEWVLADSSQEQALALWRLFEDDLATNADKEGKRFRLCGSSSVVLDQSDLGPLTQVFLFHDRAVMSWNQVEAPDASIVEDESVGMRVVLVECLSDHWRHIVRSSMMTGDDAERHSELLDRFAGEIARLSGASEQDRAFLYTYFGLNEYVTGNHSDAASRVSDNAGQLARRIPSAPLDLASLGRKGGGPASGTAATPLPVDAVYFYATAELMKGDEVE